MLSDEQMARYEQDGYVLVSGLLSDDVMDRAEVAMWRVLEMDRDDSSTWTRIPEGVEYNENRGLIAHYGVEDPDLVACATPDFMKAVAQLIGEDVDDLHVPQAVQTQNLFRVEGAPSWPGPHVDGIPKENALKTFPGPFRIAVIVYLSDVAPNGGGTVGWPGSHRKIRALAESDSEKYELLYNLNPDVKTLDLGDPIELLPKRGDVLFFQHLWAHGAPVNRLDKPRLALRFFCGCEACRRWKKAGKWSFWTP